MTVLYHFAEVHLVCVYFFCACVSACLSAISNEWVFLCKSLKGACVRCSKEKQAYQHSDVCPEFDTKLQPYFKIDSIYFSPQHSAHSTPNARNL